MPIKPLCSVLVAVLLTLPAPDARALKAPHVTATIKVRPGQVDVTYRLDLNALAKPTDQAVRLDFFPCKLEREPGGCAAFVKLRGRGKTWGPWPGTFTARGGKLELRYRVALRHHLRGPVYGLDDVPHPHRQGWHLIGRALLPHAVQVGSSKVGGVRAALRFELPNGWRLTTPFGDHSPELDGRYDRLVHNVYYAGRHSVQTLRQGKALIRVASGDFSAAQLKPALALIQKVLTEGERLLGPPSGEQVLIVFDRQRDGFNGGVIGGAITLTSPGPPLGRGQSPAGVVLVHELAHLWNRADAFWLNEGYTRLLEQILKLRVDGASDQQALDALLSVHRAQLRRARAGQKLATSRGPWAYDAGAEALFCADAMLAKEGKSIAAVHRATRAAGPPGQLKAALFLKQLAKASAKVRRRLGRWLVGSAPIPFERCLALRGYAPRRRPVRRIKLEAVEDSVLKVKRITRFGLLVLQPGRSKLRRGDRLLRVNGAPVSRLQEVAWQLRDLRPAAKIVLELVRRGRLREVTLSMPKLSDEAAPRTDGLEVSLPGPKVQRWWGSR